MKLYCVCLAIPLPVIFLEASKRGLVFALRKCRRCMITSSDIYVKVSDVYKINEYTCLKHPILFAFSSMQTS